MNRATELHNSQLSIEPDVIFLILGGNDALMGFEIGSHNGVHDVYDFKTETYIGDCTLFAQAYATMVHKVKNRYPKAEIYVFSMLHWEPKKHNKGLFGYNEVIEKIANQFGVNYVDFYNGTDISPDTAHIYLHSDGIHPNKQGFEQMSDSLVRVLKSKYAE